MIKRYLYKAPVIKYMLIWCVIFIALWWAAVGFSYGSRKAYVYALGEWALYEGQGSVVQQCLNLRVTSVPQALTFEDQAILNVMERQQPSLLSKIQDIRFTEMLSDTDRSSLCDAYAALGQKDNENAVQGVKAP